MIEISYGKLFADATREYIIKTDCKTSGEFIEEWLKTRPEEWGYFRIYKSIRPSTTSLVCGYKDGKLISDYFYDHKEFDSKIEKIHGGGGWSRSDFYIVIKEES